MGGCRRPDAGTRTSTRRNGKPRKPGGAIIYVLNRGSPCHVRARYSNISEPTL